MKRFLSPALSLLLSLTLALSVVAGAPKAEGAFTVPPPGTVPAMEPAEAREYWDQFIQEFRRDGPNAGIRIAAFDYEHYFAQRYPGKTKEQVMAERQMENLGDLEQYLLVLRIHDWVAEDEYNTKMDRFEKLHRHDAVPFNPVKWFYAHHKEPINDFLIAHNISTEPVMGDYGYDFFCLMAMEFMDTPEGALPPIPVLTYEEQLEKNSREAYLIGRGGQADKLNIMVNGLCAINYDRDFIYVRDGAIFVEDGTFGGPPAQPPMVAGAHYDTARPLREEGKESGYEVFWDKKYQTAVLVDRYTLAKRLDEDFKIVNSFLRREADTEAFESTMKWTASLRPAGGTSADARQLSGEKTVLTKGYVTQTDSVCDLSQLENWSGYGRAADRWKLLPEENTPGGVKNLLKSFSVEKRHGNSGTFTRSAALSTRYKKLPQGAWMAESRDDGVYTVGDMLCDLALQKAGGDYVTLWEDAMDLGKQYAQLFGDRCFADTSKGLSYRMTRTGLDGAVDDWTLGTPPSKLFDEFRVDLYKNKDGTAGGSFRIVPNKKAMGNACDGTLSLAEAFWDYANYEFSGSFSGGPYGGRLNLTVVNGQNETLTLNGTEVHKSTYRTPAAIPHRNDWQVPQIAL